MTFDFTEVIPNIAYPDYANHIITADTNFPGTIKHININVTIKEVSTSHGRCYTIDFDCELRQKEYITLYINVPASSGKMVIFAHERHNEIGIDFGNWPIKPMTLVLQPGDLSSLIFHKSHIAKRQESQCARSNGYSYPRCIQNWAKWSYRYLGLGENMTSMAIIILLLH